MRIVVPVVVLLSLACGGGGAPADPPPAPVPVVVEPVPAPAPEPPPAPEPVSAEGVTAVVAPFNGQDVVLLCVKGAEAVPCPTGPCGEDGACEPGPGVRGVGVASGDGEVVAIPTGTTRLTAWADDFCSGASAEAFEGAGTLAGRPYQVLEDADAALAPAREVVGADIAFETAWVIDLDGDGTNEVLVEARPATGNVLIVLRASGATVVWDTRQEPLGDDVDEYARAEHARLRTSLHLVGLTDVEGDGVLEVVAEGSSYESSWIVVMSLDGKDLGSVGCAV